MKEVRFQRDCLLSSPLHIVAKYSKKGVSISFEAFGCFKIRELGFVSESNGLFFSPFRGYLDASDDFFLVPHGSNSELLSSLWRF